jgi:predicted GNAT superfamily acetyltransferase
VHVPSISALRRRTIGRSAESADAGRAALAVDRPMAVAPAAPHLGDMSEPQIREAHGAELVAGADLLATALGFATRDAIAPWLMQTCATHGGLCLGAFDGPRLIGFSFAIATDDSSLFSCGLAVAPEHRGAGVGRRLKLAQRAHALQRGIERIRWTAEPLSAAALSLYLSGLGASLSSYEPELYADVRSAAVPPDDVVIDWALTGSPERRPGEVRRVEIPVEHRSLAAGELAAWRGRVRAEMCGALDAGLAGTAVERRERRAWVCFELR